MKLDTLTEMISALSYSEIKNHQNRIILELTHLGIPQKKQEKILESIFKIVKITDNPKTRVSFLKSFVRIIQNDIEKDGRDSSIIIEITKKCNKNCTHCYSKHAGQQLEMSDDTLNFLVHFSRKNFKHIFFTGGEPTLDRRILTIAKENPDIMFFLFTNGSILTKEYAEELAILGNVIPLLGIDGRSASTHDRFRGKGSYAEILRAIKNLNDCNVCWGFITLVAENNADEVLSQEFLDDKIRKGAIIARYLEYIPVGPRPLFDCILSGENYYKMEKRKHQIVKSGKIYMQEIGESKCSGLLFFTVNGDIKNCFCFHYAKYNVHSGELKDSVEKTRKDWISYNWEGECPIYSDPIGFKKYLEKKGWHYLSKAEEPYLINNELAQQLKDHYQTFLKLKAKKGYN